MRGHTAVWRQELCMDSRLLVPHRDEIKEEMKNAKKKREKKLVNKNE